MAGRSLVALYAAALRNNDQGISCSGSEKGPIEAGYGIHAIPAFHLPLPRGQINPVAASRIECQGSNEGRGRTKARELWKSKLGKQQLGATASYLPRWTIRAPRRAGFGSADWNSCDLAKGGLS